MIWYKEERDKIVISTRIRLARNIKKYPFPDSMTEAQNVSAIKDIEDALVGGNSVLAKTFTTMKISELDDIKRGGLVEKHLISPNLKNRASVMVSDDENMSIMLMEEDHIRLQVIKGGFCLKDAWDLANKVDDLLEEQLEYAFHKDFGYLTACPTNVGTGLRASVMMHLPALTMTNNMDRIISSASNLGIAVRGLYGEGSKAHGSLYQISNQVTMGLSEEELILKLENIVGQIKNHEEKMREKLIADSKDELEDRLWRSYGALKFARKMTSTEAKSLISDVILGTDLGIIKDDNKNMVELMIKTEPANLSEGESEALDPQKRDRKRAEILREFI